MPRTRKTTAPTPEVIEAAEQQAAGDAALLEALQQRDSLPTQQKNPTISDNFFMSAAMLAQARKTYRLNEGTLIKLYELNLMWALNNRQTTDAALVRDDELVTPPEDAEDTPAPGPEDVNEVITAAEES